MPPKLLSSITLSVSPSFQLPPFYTTSSPEAIEEALRIGAHLYDTVRHASYTTTLADIETSKAAEIKRIRDEAASRIQVLEKQRFELQEVARKEEREAAEPQLRSLQIRIEGLQANRSADIQAAENRTTALLQRTLDEKQRSIERLEKQLEQLFAKQLAQQQEELRSLSEYIRKKPSANAKVKGNEYEELFYEKLVAAFGLCDGFRLDAKGNKAGGHEADFLMTLGKNTVVWEVKNYEKSVGQVEVDKFHRDMKENQLARIGVMVSRFTPIVGKTATGDFEVEFREGQMLVYLSRFEQMGDTTLPQLLLLFRHHWESERPVDDVESKEETIRQIVKLHERAVKAKTDWRLHKSRLDDAMRWMADQVEESEAKLQQALNVIRGATLIELPEGLFRDVAGDEKDQQLVQLILEYATPDPHGSILLNDVADFVSNKKGLSKDTAKKHIRAVLLDGRIESIKGKAVRILGLSVHLHATTNTTHVP